MKTETTELIPATTLYPRKWHIVTTDGRHTLWFYNTPRQTVPASCVELLITIRDNLNAEALPSADVPAWSIQIQTKTGRVRACYHNPSAVCPNTATAWQHFHHIPSLARQVAHLNTRVAPWRDKVECLADAM